MLVLGGLRAVWGRHATKVLAAEHARLRAAGEPVEPEDLNPPPVPPGRNAAAFYQQATAVRNRTVENPASSNFDFPEYPPYPPRWHKMADASVAANGLVFPPLRLARLRDEADWGTRFGSPMIAVPLPTLNPSRDLANFATDAALREHVRGNDAAALELVRDVRHLSSTVARQPVLVSQLVAIGIDALALHRLKVIAPALAVTEGDDLPVGPPAPDGPATRGQVEALIAELLREPPPETGLQLGYQGERVFAADNVRWMTRGNWVLRPLFQIEERRAMAEQERRIAAATQPTLAATQAALPTASPAEQRRLSALLSRLVMGSSDAAMQQRLRVVMERRFAAVALAVRLYRLDHGGAWPASLDALVPAYLPAVPADPFATDGEPLRYRLVRGATPLFGDRPIVYSVGDDGIDDIASGAMPLPPDPQYGWERGPDQPRDLSRWLPLPDPAKLPSALLGADRNNSPSAGGIAPMPGWMESGKDEAPATAPATRASE